MFVEGFPNQCRPIHLLALGSPVGGLEQAGVEHYLDCLHCGHLSTVYSTPQPSGSHC